MSGVTRVALISRLTELGVAFNKFEHPASSTVEEQVKYCNVGEEGFTKNLLLKDKKGRLYLVSALITTNVDLKILSQRLGLGKGGLRFAPEEVVGAVLKVSLRGVTPFALLNESARNVALLLDKNFQTLPHIFFHPLSSDMTISIEPCGLDSFLDSIKRKPCYVDLEAVVAVGKDQPPDLTAHVPVDAHASTDLKDIPEVLESKSGQKSLAETVENALKGSPEKPLQAKEKSGSRNASKTSKEVDFSDMQSFVSHVIHKTASAVLSEVSWNSQQEHVNNTESDVAGAVSRTLSPEIEGLLMMFKNTAYTQGFFAGVQSKSSPR